MPYKRVNQILVRNFLIFVVILLTCSGTLMYSMVSGDRELYETDSLLLQAHNVITTAEQVSTLVEGMLADQRGYLLTGNSDFMTFYEEKKSEVSNHIANLYAMTGNAPAQQSRLTEIRGYFNDLSKELESNAKAHVIAPITDEGTLKDIEIVDGLKDNIVRINNAVLDHQYGVLNNSFERLEQAKKQYLATLLVSVSIGTALLLILNAFLLHAQRSRTRVEANLKDTEERFMLAIEGTEDGVFDWDIHNKKMFFSTRYFSMLGYDIKGHTGDPDDVRKYVHPEDIDKINTTVKQYLRGELSEYRQEYRMKHKSGRWVWIQSRAKALYDNDGVAYRMVGAHTDITPVVKTQEKLEAEKEQAENANKAKSEFLAHMSHEIRTPLTAISGIAEILDRRKDNLDDKQQQLVHTLLFSTSALKDLVNDVLDFSKIESNELELEEKEFELDTLFEEIISMMALKANEKGISFVFDYKAIKNKVFFGDPNRIRQILVNLISNAIKFTNEGAVTIKSDIETRDNTEFMRIDIADTGIGIAPEDFDMVFERFKQGDSSVSRKYGGTGLGLPISRNLARLMGGEIFLSSEFGRGSTFSLIVPAKISNKTKGRDGTKGNNTAKKTANKLKAALTNKKKVLLVEDYKGNVVVISYILEDMDLDFDVAGTGVEALALWEKNYYDVILMDIQMPEMDGFTATKKIRSLEKHNQQNRTPIIGMTAHALIGDRDKCIQAGMDAYLPKPIVEADLKQEITHQLDKKSA